MLGSILLNLRYFPGAPMGGYVNLFWFSVCHFPPILLMFTSADKLRDLVTC